MGSNVQSSFLGDGETANARVSHRFQTEVRDKSINLLNTKKGETDFLSWRFHGNAETK